MNQTKAGLSTCVHALNLGPDAATLVYTTWFRAKQLGQKPRVLLPDHPAQLEGFCRYSGLKHLIAKGPRPTPDNPASETVPLTQFYQAVGNQSAPIITLIKRHMELSEDAEFYLGVCLSEAVQNIEDHAESPIGGVFCARFFSGSGQVRVAVVDRGIGIAGSLSKAHGPISPVEALSRVIQGEFTSKSQSRNLGLGISNLAKIVRNHAGDLVVLSGLAGSLVSAGNEQPLIRSLAFNFPGTAIFFRFNVHSYTHGQWGI